jgi:hypothetical protein
MERIAVDGGQWTNGDASSFPMGRIGTVVCLISCWCKEGRRCAFNGGNA